MFFLLLFFFNHFLHQWCLRVKAGRRIKSKVQSGGMYGVGYGSVLTRMIGYCFKANR